MQQATYPIVREVVLIGGGHSHAIALKRFGMKPILGVRLTLITDTAHTPYSGMLPGHVAGFYSFDETHIDLRRLARFAQAQFYRDRVIGLDLENNQVLCANRPPVAFDYLSIGIGSTPANISVPGAEDYAIPAKPVPKFLQAWHQLLENVKENPQQTIEISIVGGGAGGVELALNMQHRIAKLLQADQQPPDNLNIDLFQRGTRLLSHHSRSVSQRLKQTLQQQGIRLHLAENVTQLLPGKVICESGLTVECDYTFWVTQAAAPGWIKASGLATDAKGFILVKDTLQSVSHAHIFAAGDIATMQNHSRPKAGVFAVRQGKPLSEDLERILLRKPLKTYVPQKRYLSLIGTGDKSAVASWGAFSWQSSLLWYWKDLIDRAFMRRFSDLPQMEQMKNRANDSLITQQEADSNHSMRCAGCGSKVGSTTLERVLQRLELPQSDAVLIGLYAPDDAAVLKVPGDCLMVHTLDHFRSPINDPFIFGQIVANHCLSDIYAMGATPQSVLAVATVPYGTEDKMEETLYQLLGGAAKVLQADRVPLVGGHTAEGTELAFGLSCNGLATFEELLPKGGMQPGQVLILTKAIGTGALLAADMRYQAKGRWIDEAVASMLQSNREAATVLRQYGATACTDVTGFGLLGHLVEMVKASGVGVQLDLATIPVLAGAMETMSRGITSSLQPQNLKASRYIDNSEIASAPKYPLLFDPQTAGGLLAALPLDKAEACVRALQALGYKDTCIVGRVILATAPTRPITFMST